jgi:hypothetical protein
MAALGTNYGEQFGRKSLQRFFASAISPKITNNKWEGQLKGGRGDRVNILTYGLNAWEDYTGSDITFRDVTEVEGQLILSEQRHNAFKIKDWDRFKTYATDIDSTEVSNVAELLKEEVDTFNLALYTKAGRIVGTDYTTGTLSIDVSGNVTGSGTTFTEAMEGAKFKAVGHTKWYRVKDYASATGITIEEDVDDVIATYGGGAIGTTAAQVAYEIEGYAKKQIAKDTIDGFILEAKEQLDENKIPKKDRFLVVSHKIESILLQSAMLTPYTPSVAEDVVKLGIIGMYRGFKVFSSPHVNGDNSLGYNCIAGHPQAITHAFVQISSKTVADLENNFGKGYKQLVAYGSKVLDERRKALVHLWLYV